MPPAAIKALIIRDIRLVWRRRGDTAQPALFALLVVILFALALGDQTQLLPKIAATVLWMAALLAGLLSLDSLFRSDAEDGSLEQWVLAPIALPFLILTRTLIHWATTSLPILIVTPLLSQLLHLPNDQLPILLTSLMLGTPILSLIGAVVAALTINMRRAGILIALLVLPLYTPVLIFGSGSVSAASQGLDPTGGLLLLGAGLIIALVLTPLTAAAAIHISLS